MTEHDGTFTAEYSDDFAGRKEGAPDQKSRKRQGIKTTTIVNAIVIAVTVLLALMFFTSFATQRGHSLFGFRSYIVVTGSMSPAFDAGSFILVREKLPNELDIGDVISYTVSDGKTVLTHRIVEKNDVDGQLSFITKGDANNANDDRPVAPESVLGKVVLSVNYIGAFFLSLREPQNIALCAGIIAVIFLAPELYRWLTREKKTEKKTVEAK